MRKTPLKVLAIAIAFFALAGCQEQELTDNRDGKTYAVTKIGKQVWMAQNLDYDDTYRSHSSCYDDNPDNCAKYGRLYIWHAAKRACPAGWHLPTAKEWDELEATLGKDAKNKLMSRDWGGTDAVGFRALPAGYREPIVKDCFSYLPGKSSGMGADAYFWTATEGASSYYTYNYRGIFSDNTGLNQGAALESNAYSVRCVKD